MRKAMGFSLVVLLLTLATGCNVGGELFTQKELDEMYVLDASQGQKALNQGLPIDVKKPVEISVKIMEGAPSPSFVNVSLLNSSGKVFAQVSFAKKKSEIVVGKGIILVDSFEDPLPPLTLPTELDFGYYILRTQMLDQDSAVLSVIEKPILVYDEILPQMSISLYPAQLTASKSALFIAMLNGHVPKDAWISWKIDGVVYSEGFVSEKYDRIIWTAPADKGIHSITADFFPFKPLADLVVLPLVSSDIKTPVVTPPVSAMPDPAGEPFVLFDFNKGLESAGKKSLAGKKLLGLKHYPEEFSNGYGFVLGGASGLSYQNSMIPWEISGNQDFAMVFSLTEFAKPSQAEDSEVIEKNEPEIPSTVSIPKFTEFDTPVVKVSATPKTVDSFTESVKEGAAIGTVLFSAFDVANKLVFEIGIDKQMPYVKTDIKVTGTLPIPSELSTLIFNFKASGGFLEVSIYIDGKIAGSGKIKDKRIGATQGASVLSGNNGYRAIFNEVAVYDHLIPAYFVSMLDVYSESLIHAISFEDVMPAVKPFALFGKSAVLRSKGGLSLAGAKDGFSVEIPAGTTKFKAVLKTRNGVPSIQVAFDGDRSFIINQAGELRYKDKVIGVLGITSDTQTQILIERRNNSILVSDELRKNIVTIPENAIAFKNISFSPADSSALDVQSLLVLNLPK